MTEQNEHAFRDLIRSILGEDISILGEDISIPNALNAAGAAMHFVLDEPGMMDKFADYVAQANDGRRGTVQGLRRIVMDAHNRLQPECQKLYGPN